MPETITLDQSTHPSHLLTTLVADTESTRSGITTIRTHRLRWFGHHDSGVVTQACAPDSKPYNVVPGSLDDIFAPGSHDATCTRCLQFIAMAEERGTNIYSLVGAEEEGTTFTIRTPAEARTSAHLPGRRHEEKPPMSTTTNPPTITTISAQELRRDFLQVVKSVPHAQYRDAAEYAWSQVRPRTISMANQSAGSIVRHLLQHPDAIGTQLTRSPVNPALSGKKKVSEGKVHLTRVNPHAELGFNQLCQDMNARTSYRIHSTSDDDASMSVTCRVCSKIHEILVEGLEHTSRLLDVDLDLLVSITKGNLKDGAVGNRVDDEVIAKLQAMAAGKPLVSETETPTTTPEPIIEETAPEPPVVDEAPEHESIARKALRLQDAEMGTAIEELKATRGHKLKPTSMRIEEWLLGTMGVARDRDGITHQTRWRALARVWADDPTFREEIERVAAMILAADDQDVEPESTLGMIERGAPADEAHPRTPLDEEITTRHVVPAVHRRDVDEVLTAWGLDLDRLAGEVVVTTKEITARALDGSTIVVPVTPTIEDGIYELTYTQAGAGEITELVRATEGAYRSNFFRPEAIPDDLVAVKIA